MMAPARPERREAAVMGRTPWDTCREVREKCDWDEDEDDDDDVVVGSISSKAEKPQERKQSNGNTPSMINAAAKSNINAAICMDDCLFPSSR